MQGVPAGLAFASCVIALCGFVDAVVAGSVEALDECDARVRSAPRDPMSYYCYFQAFRAGAPGDETMRRLEGILVVNPDLHRARMFIGMIESDLGGHRAEQLLREAVRGMEEDGDHHGVVYGTLPLAYLLGNEGRLDEAESWIDLAERAAESSGDPELPLHVLTEQALMALRRAEYGRALHLYRKAEAAVFPDGPAWLQGNVLSGISHLQWYFGDLRAALATAQRELEIRQAEGEWRGVAAALSHQAYLAVILWSRDEFPDEACRSLVEKALEAVTAAGDLESESRLRFLRAKLLEGEDAVRECERAVDVARRGGDAAAQWSAMSSLAQMKLDLGDRYEDEAFALIESVVEEARGAGMPWSVVTALFRRAELVSETRGRDEAIAAWEESIDAAESIGRLEEEDVSRALTMSHWSYPYHQMVSLLLDHLTGSSEPDADLEKAFLTMARRQARSLLEVLAGKEGEPGAAEGGRYPTIAEVRSNLHDDEVMLVYQIGKERGGRSWLLAISPDGVEVRELAGSRDLDDAVTMFEGMFRAGDEHALDSAADLFDMVTGGALDDRIDRLGTIILVPDGPLHRLPFTALRERPDADPLGTRVRVDVIPAAALWMRWRTSPSRGGRGAALSLADPEISQDAMFLAFRDPALRGGELPLRGLPRALEEGRSVARTIGGESRVLTGEAASESALKMMDPTAYGLLHFATHAVVDGARPELSAVLLAPGEGGEDGLLLAGEIARLDLKDQVVILSACRGASGPVIEGEGVMGLARAFLLAGARAVVANRWPYNDEDAARLTKVIAAEVGRGASIGDALTEARRAHAASGAPVASWAGLTLIGDGGAVPIPGGNRSFMGAATILLVMVVVAVVMLWVLFRGRRR
jgi:tetratricopeptide (TPR) repeat protein